MSCRRSSSARRVALVRGACPAGGEHGAGRRTPQNSVSGAGVGYTPPLDRPHTVHRGSRSVPRSVDAAHDPGPSMSPSHVNTPMKVVVVLPAYNAAKTLERTCAEIPSQTVDEILLV